MIDLPALQTVFRQYGLDRWADLLPEQLRQVFEEASHGDFGRWKYILEGMPEVATHDVDINADEIRIGRAGELEAEVAVSLQQSLRALQPWRKGPYSVFGIRIDTEWRSDWKWQRLVPHISPLKNRRVLDVGCGSGYHCWRMAGEGAALVVGIDPNLLFLTQFTSLKKLMADPAPVYFLPVGMEQVPDELGAFDTVFSMGILYHRRSPIDHLVQLKNTLRKGGELVLETLVIDGDENQVLLPPGRYAKMRNVWFIPSAKALSVWLKKSGFSSIRLVDCSKTTVEEQRATDWMRFESLSDFLDPTDPARTVEGHPAPVRAILVATA